MTKEEAKQVFLSRGYVEVEGGTIFDANKWREACVVISEWLEQEPCEDAISRQEAIKMFTYNYKGERIPNYDCDNFPVQIAMKTVKKMLRELPPVKPQEPTTVLYSGDGYADGYMVYDMAECPNCGYEYENGDKDWGLSFCPSCGQALKWEVEQDADSN